jgi:predicted  nucleic acid-binding Zn-ribbon protein
MNAVMREEYEAPVVPNETIEASIGSLRTGLTEVKEDVRGVQADVRSLRDKVDRNYESLSAKQDSHWQKIDHTRAELLDRVEAVRTELNTKIDQVDSKLSAKIDQLHMMLGRTNVALANLSSLHKTLVWVVGGIVSVMGLIEIAIRLGKTFGWL